MAKLTEDVCLVLSMVFTKLNIKNYLKIWYNFSEVFLIVALIVRVVERIKK